MKTVYLKRFFSLLAIPLIAATFFSCNDDDNDSAYVDVKVINNKLNFTSEVGYKTVTVESSSDWAVDVPADAASWLTVSPNVGSNRESFAIEVKANDAPNALDRDATLRIVLRNNTNVSTTLKIEQKGIITDYLELDGDAAGGEIRISDAGTTHTIGVLSDGKWEVSAQTGRQSWFTLNTTEGEGNGNISYTVTRNREVESRDITLTVTYTERPSLTTTVKIVQSPLSGDYVYFLDTEDDVIDIVVPFEGGDYTFQLATGLETKWSIIGNSDLLNNMIASGTEITWERFQFGQTAYLEVYVSIKEWLELEAPEYEGEIHIRAYEDPDALYLVRFTQEGNPSGPSTEVIKEGDMAELSGSFGELFKWNYSFDRDDAIVTEYSTQYGGFQGYNVTLPGVEEGYDAEGVRVTFTCSDYEGFVSSFGLYGGFEDWNTMTTNSDIEFYVNDEHVATSIINFYGASEQKFPAWDYTGDYTPVEAPELKIVVNIHNFPFLLKDLRINR